MTVQIDWDFAGDDDARAEIGAAVRYLLRDVTGSLRGDVVQEIIEVVRDAANGLLSPQHPLEVAEAKQAPMSGIPYQGLCDRCLQARYRSMARYHPQIERQENPGRRPARGARRSHHRCRCADRREGCRACEKSDR